MALPLVGYSYPTVRIPASGPASLFMYGNGFRQAKPYTLPSDSFRVKKRLDDLRHGVNPGMENNFSTNTGGVPFTIDYIDASGPNMSQIVGARDDAMNMALKRLQAIAYDEQASLGAAIGESRKSISTLTKRVSQLYRGFKALKKLRFYDAAYEFNLVREKRPKKRRVGKTGKLYWAQHPVTKKYYPRPRLKTDGRYVVQSFAGLTLEYNFGWSPLVKDVQSAVAVINRDPFCDRNIRASGSAKIRFEAPTRTNSYDYIHYHSVAFRAAAGGTYRVSNPNYDLADRLGLVSLADVALELTPFSFVVDWFVNLDEFVGNLSDGYKSNMVNTWHSLKCQSEHDYRIYYREFGRFDHWSVASGNSYKRVTGSLPSVALRVRQRFMPSFTRAANASSLLVVLFSKKS